MKNSFKLFVPRDLTPFSPTPRTAFSERRKADEVADAFALWFGGATMAEVTGIWTNADGKLVREPITTVESFADDAAYLQHKADVYELAQKVCNTLCQDAIALVDCGRMVMVVAGFSKAALAEAA